ncbi:hypothetical protein JW992_08950 [candidate division KSB1 bacterium]|nr:hypothetical protein [candidate division KSB1 bacterium]
MKWKCILTVALTVFLASGIQSLSAQGLTDEFDRTTLGGNWAAHADFGISAGTLVNTSTVNGWNFLATFTGAANPIEVSMVFSATKSDADGVNAAGLAIYLDSPSATASGYLVYRRYGKIYLWKLVNGSLDQELNSVNTSQALPAPGDLITVTPRKEADATYFDFKVNGVLNGTVKDIGKTYGAGTTYAGVVLYGNYANKNNIESFTVRAPFINVTYPVGGEVIPGGTAQDITWTSEEVPENVDISISYDSGATWTAIATNVANSGTYNYTFPDEDHANCRIKVVKTGSTMPVGISPADFTIEQQTPTLTVLSPNGGEKWIIGTRKNITWRKTGSIDFIDIYYTRDNGATRNLIEGSVPADLGFYEWEIPGNLYSDSMKIIIEKNVLDRKYSDESDAVFSVQALVHLYIQNASGEPGTSNNIVRIGMDNKINVWALTFRITDSRSVLSVPTIGSPPQLKISPVGRAKQLTVASQQGTNYVSIGIVNMTGVIPTGTGTIIEIYYDIDNDPSLLGGSSELMLSTVLIADIDGKPVLGRLTNGVFHYVQAGDLVSVFGVVDDDDIGKMIEIALGISPPDDYFLSGDMDNDGDIDIFDVLQVYDLAYPDPAP